MNAKRIVVSAITSLAFAASMWAAQDAPKQQPDASKPQTEQQLLSVSGKIASVDKDSFTLNVVSGQAAPAPQQLQQTPSAKTMTFTVDKNTTVDGKLAVNSNAEVVYRQDAGANIAISVRVTP